MDDIGGIRAIVSNIAELQKLRKPYTDGAHELLHTWATAVETFEAFMGEKFKSSQGAQEWLDFFALVASGAHDEELLAGC